MDVHVVTASNADYYRAEMDQYFFERHKIYAEELHWVPEVPNRREYDAYDTEYAVHFLGLEDGRLIAGSRLVPTHLPHLLKDVFSHLCTSGGGLTCRPDVAEWTRGFICRDAREGTNKRVLFQFCHAVMEYALREGITQLGGMQRTYWLSMWDRMGWNVHPKGEPTLFGNEPWLPAYFDVSHSALEGAKRWARLDSSILTHRGSIVPFIYGNRAA